MAPSLTGRSLLTLRDFSLQEIRALLDRAHAVKKESLEKARFSRFAGMSLALLFEKRSTRTRCAFETAFGEEGGHPVFLSTQDIHLGAKESLEDTARVFGRMFDAIQFRGYRQETAEILARYSGIPVYNGLTDSYHPTQALADLMTVEERFGAISGLHIAYVGDGRNNVAVSLIVGCAKMGANITIVAPEELRPAQSLLDDMTAIASEPKPMIRYLDSMDDGVAGAHVVYTDVWTSMGEEDQADHRREILSPYQVNAHLMKKTGRRNTIFLHCLPAVRDEEVTSAVLDGPQSAVWDQAENRKHTIKALMLETLF